MQAHSGNVPNVRFWRAPGIFPVLPLRAQGQAASMDP